MGERWLQGPDVSDGGVNEPEGLRVRVRNSFSVPGLQRIETAYLKEGPRTWRTASLLWFGKSRKTISHVEFHGRDWSLSGNGWRETAARRWSCRDAEVAALREFLTAELSGVGDYSLVSADGALGALLKHMHEGRVGPGIIAALAGQLTEQVELVSTLDEIESVQLLGMAFNLRRQREVTEKFERLVRDPASTEPQLQAVLEDNWWLLGGNYISRVDRRHLTLLDQYDIPLLRADGVLHVIELKKANVRGAVRRHRQHCIVGPEVNAAVGQAANYLRSADEQRHLIGGEHRIECRRAFASVIVGYPGHNAQANVTPAEFREAIRTYNSHLSRIEVLTYEDLLVAARNTIRSLETQVNGETKAVGTNTAATRDNHSEEAPF